MAYCVQDQRISNFQKGTYKTNPFNFELFNISTIRIYIDREQAPAKPLKLSLSENDKTYLESYQTLFTGTGKYHDDSGNVITHNIIMGAMVSLCLI